MTPRTMCLLLTMQEHAEAGENKFMTDKKLSSQGKIAAQVVYEKERYDSFLTKAAAKLKKMEMKDKATWIEKQVAKSVNRDFKIRVGKIKAAQEREAPKKKGGKKRKSDGGEGKKKTKKQKKKPEDSDEDEDEDIDGGSVMDASVVDADASVIGESSIASIDDEQLTDSDDEDEDEE